MIWLIWRQHRVEILIVGIVLLLFAAFFLVTGVNIASEAQKSGFATCTSQQAVCLQALATFELYVHNITNSFAFYILCIVLPLLLPVLVGMFIGAHAIARELEQGTYRLIWTQGITWHRWLSRKIGMIAFIVFCAFGILCGFFFWWSLLIPVNSPLWQSLNIDFSNHFDGWGVVAIAYALFALMLGIFTGTALRKTVPAMAITLVIFVVLRIVIESLWRPYFLPPVVLTTPAILTATGPTTQIPASSWILSYGTVDRQGQPVSINAPDLVCGALLGPKATDAEVARYNRCVEDHGFQTREIYQPADRFWLLQGIESGIYLLMAAILVALTFWWTKYRILGQRMIPLTGKQLQV